MSSLQSLKRKALFDHIRANHSNVRILSTDFENVVKVSLIDLFELHNEGSEVLKNVSEIAHYFSKCLKMYWKQSKRTYEQCVSNHEKFFNVKIERSDLVSVNSSSDSVKIDFEKRDDTVCISDPLEFIDPIELYDMERLTDEDSVCDFEGPPRKKTFLMKSKSQQDKDTSKLRQTYDNDSILAAALQVLRSRGQNDSAFIFKKICDDPPLAAKLRAYLKDNSSSEATTTALECLAMTLDKGLTVSAYEAIHEKCPNIVPYYLVEREKKKCRPADIQADERNVVCPMQSLSNHSAARILEDPHVNSKIHEFYKKSGTIYFGKNEKSVGNLCTGQTHFFVWLGYQVGTFFQSQTNQ